MRVSWIPTETIMRDSQPSITRGILAGVVAGIGATIVMDQFLKLSNTGQKAIEKSRKLAEGESPWQIAHERVQEDELAVHHEDSTEIVASKIAQAIGKPPLTPEDKKRAGQAIHYSFGALMGVVYSVTAEVMPEVTTGGGTGFGTLLFLGADEVAIPALRLAPRPNRTEPFDHLQYWAAHVVYGGSLELMRSLFRRLT